MTDTDKLVDTMLPSVVWKTYANAIPASFGKDARGFEGTCGEWYFAVYEAEGNYGGAARLDFAVIYRMTAEQAERAVKLALEQIGGN